MGIGVLDGGGSCPPPPKVTKSKSLANVEHKSGEEWEIKKPKMPKSPQFVGQTKAVGQYSLHSGQYWLIIKMGQIMSILWLI
jgi:hypothetical protein